MLRLALMLASLLTAPADGPAYLFTSFRDKGDGLHLAWSLDGRVWTDLDKRFLTPTVGAKLLRDPHVLLGPDGLYHMVWTSGWTDAGIGYATSPDLVNWSEQRFLPLMAGVTDTKTCWAPEVYWDDATKRYVIVWSSNVPADGKDRHRAYFTTTADFAAFDQPRILFDPGFDNIDATITRRGDGKFVCVFKQTDDQPAKRWGSIHAAVADAITGPYAVLPESPIEKKRVEGPAAVTLPDGRTLLYVDHYADHRYSTLETTDWRSWRDVSRDGFVADGQRHGSIFTVPRPLLESLRADERKVIASVPKPAIDGLAADPAIRAFGDKYYIYPTSDRPFWETTDFSVWSSPDLVTWTRERMILDVTRELAWANLRAWAPDCIERDGKYYFYFCADAKIGVATADAPTGPFRDALGKPLLQKGGKVTVGQTIDPHAFIDDDGQAYLYYGNGRHAQVVKLKPDMVTIDGDPVDIQLRDFREAVVVFKRGGKYHFQWSIDDARSPDYRVGWGVSDSPLGPVTTPAGKAFIVLKKNGHAVGTAHHSVVNVPGTDRWYVAYHRHAVPGGGGYRREVCLARMTFDADGAVVPMDPLVAPFQPGDVGEPLVNGRGLTDPTSRP